MKLGTGICWQRVGVGEYGKPPRFVLDVVVPAGPDEDRRAQTVAAVLCTVWLGEALSAES